MHPAFSVIFFTVTAGVGYGVFLWWTLLILTGNLSLINGMDAFWLAFIGMGLITAGLISSSFHLANPKNAWRAFSRFRTSWLSREAVFAVLFYPPAGALVLLLWLGWFENFHAWLLPILAAVTWILAFITVYATGMIYACLKTIRQWHSPLVPANYLLAALISGGTLLLALAPWFQWQLPPILLVAVAATLVLALIIKSFYYIWIGRPSGPTINTATGFTIAAVRLLDVGHSAGTFLTEEFGYQLKHNTVLLLRNLSLLLAYLLPFALVILSILQADLARYVLPFAAASVYVGLFIERSLFFAEARHVVNLYHGAART
jgi:DMSO reductase anchor subunit